MRNNLPSHKDIFKEMASGMPTAFKIWFVVGPLLGLGLMGFLVWAIYHVVMATT